MDTLLATLVGGIIALSSALGIKILDYKRESTQRKRYLYTKLNGVADSYVQAEITRNQAFILSNYHERMRFAKGVDKARHKDHSEKDLVTAKEYLSLSTELKRELNEVLAEISLVFVSKNVLKSIEEINLSQQISSVKEFPESADYEELMSIRKMYDEQLKSTLNKYWKSPIRILKSAMKDEIQTRKSNTIPSAKRWVVAGVLVLGILLSYDFSPLGGNIRFYSNWAQCGQKPVATLGSGYMNAGARHYIEAPNFSLHRPSIEYFCTPLEAEKAGYSATDDRYYFPQLNKNEN